MSGDANSSSVDTRVLLLHIDVVFSCKVLFSSSPTFQFTMGSQRSVFAVKFDVDSARECHH